MKEILTNHFRFINEHWQIFAGILGLLVMLVVAAYHKPIEKFFGFEPPVFDFQEDLEVNDVEIPVVDFDPHDYPETDVVNRYSLRAQDLPPGADPVYGANGEVVGYCFIEPIPGPSG